MPYDEPLTVAVCPSCSTPVYRLKVGGLETTADMTALDSPAAVGEVISGRRLYRIVFTGGRPLAMYPADNLVLSKLATAEPGDRPFVVAGHPCTAVSRPFTAPVDPEAGSGPKDRPAGPQTPSRVPQTDPSGVPSAETPRSDGPRCSGCGQPCADGTYASVAVGELTVWAAHVLECPGTGQNGA